MSLYAEYLKRCPDLLKCLENSRHSGRFAHSFLVHAPDERTRDEFAVILQQLAGCKNPVNGRPDLSCSFCKQVEAGIYPDLFKIAPEGKMFQIRVGDRENPESNTLRDMLDHLGYTSGEHRKFGLICDADRMGKEAQNALLKTLEEPPPETTIILCTANPSALLPTTRSRCQLISLPDNHCRFEFDGASATAAAMYELCFECTNDIAKTENTLLKLLEIASKFADAAMAEAENEFAALTSAAAASGDPAYTRQIKERIEDTASGNYIRKRRRFTALITTFCLQLYLLSQGAARTELPNPEIFDHLAIPLNISPEKGEIFLKEAEALESTLRYNVNDELALRTFAVNITMS